MRIKKLNKFYNMTNFFKKTIMVAVLITAFWLTTIVGAFAQFSGGTGIESDPFIITTAAEMEQLGVFVNDGNTVYNDRYYKLGNDIDLSAYQSGSGWMPIGYYSAFKGHFDGNNKVIFGLKINFTTGNVGSLFATIEEGGSVRNLGVENIDITVSSNVSGFHNIAGGIVAILNNGSLQNCYSTGSITVTSMAENSSAVAGGLVGWHNYGGNVQNCYSSCVISVYSQSFNVFVGGITGFIADGNLSNCYSIGLLTANAINGNVYAGGVVATNSNGNEVSNVAALNPRIDCVGATIYCGRVVGSNEGTLTNNIAFDEMINPNGGTTWGHIGGEAIDGANIDKDFISSNATLGTRFTGEGGWTTQNGKLPGLFGNTVDMPLHLLISGPFDGGGTETDPYIITTAEQLEQLRIFVNTNNENFNNKYYKLGNDIDLSEYGENYNDGNGWIPIGINNTVPFRGVFDGNNKKITGLYVNMDFNNSDVPYRKLGLFGYISNGTVKNLGLESVYINSENYQDAGTIACEIRNGSIINCYATGVISVGISQTFAGGIVGYVNESSISNCHSSVNISGSSVGGITTYVYNNSTVSNCYSTGSINTSCYDVGISVLGGGVVGSIEHSSIENCYSIGSINAFTEGNYVYVGGVVGYLNDSSITNSYSTGSINTSSEGLYSVNVGGIMGAGYQVSITNSYSTGSINAFGEGNWVYAGGIMGGGYEGSITNSYSTGSITASSNEQSFSGGIVGILTYFNLSNCYSTGQISSYSSHNFAGGIAGSNRGQSIITNCYSISSIIASGDDISFAGGIVGGSRWEGEISNCAALNPSISCVGERASFGRIVGSNYIGEEAALTNNIAFNEMLNPAGQFVWNNVGFDLKDGANIDIPTIHSDSSLNGRFTSEGGWTTQNGKLPGLFGNTVDMPEHLRLVGLPEITTTSLPDGTVGEEYTATLVATGNEPIIWSILETQSETLPDGLTLSPDGIISGIPTEDGIFTFTVKATNDVGSDSRDLTISIVNVDIPDNSIANQLVACSENGILYVSGLIPCEKWGIYDISGRLIYENVTPVAVEQLSVTSLRLQNGIYIIKTGNRAIKVRIYR